LKGRVAGAIGIAHERVVTQYYIVVHAAALLVDCAYVWQQCKASECEQREGRTGDIGHFFVGLFPFIFPQNSARKLPKTGSCYSIGYAVANRMQSATP
jgi:hypothetical protein